MPADRIPVSTLADLDTLDEAEIVEGYWDGRAGEPEPGNNRSRSYWHGWRNGRVDGGHDKGDQAMRALARAVVESRKAGSGSEKSDAPSAPDPHPVRTCVANREPLPHPDRTGSEPCPTRAA